MSGKYRGTQAFIRDECPYAEYVPCMAHSLNLVGKCAVESYPAVVALFNLIQKVYNTLWHLLIAGESIVKLYRIARIQVDS